MYVPWRRSKVDNALHMINMASDQSMSAVTLEAEAGGSLECQEYKANLGNMERHDMETKEEDKDKQKGEEVIQMEKPLSCTEVGVFQL